MRARSVYGLRILSNAPLAALTPLPACTEHDLVLELGPLPRAFAGGPRRQLYESSADGSSDFSMTASRGDDGSFYELAYGDGTRVVLDETATRIWASAPDTATMEDTAAYVLGPALGWALSLRGTTSLHASVVGIGDRAIVFTGPEGAGKSTLAAAFARRGSRVLSDDLAPLVDRGSHFDVHPGYPRVRLWPESVEMLFGAADALPRISESWDKRFLALEAARFPSGPLALGAIYVIGSRANLDAPRIEPMLGHTAVMSLIANSYAGRLLDRGQRRREFELLGRVAQNVPVRRLVPSDDPTRLDALCELVAADAAALAAARV